MSGAGRQHRAKHLTHAKTEDKFGEGVEIMRLRGARGGNIHEVESASGTVHLVLLPSKFKRVIWVKRGDIITVEPFSIAGTSAQPSATAEVEPSDATADPSVSAPAPAGSVETSGAGTEPQGTYYGLIRGVLTHDEVRALSKSGEIPQVFAPAQRSAAAWGVSNPNRRRDEESEAEEEDEEAEVEEDYEVEEAEE